MGHTAGGICRNLRRSCSRHSPTGGCHHRAVRSTSVAGWAPRRLICTGPGGAPRVDLSPVAVAAAARRHPGPSFVQADLLRLPLPSSSFDAGLDRGCFHYLAADDRPGYAAELRRVLRPGGKLLLRASLRAAGVRNDIDEEVILAVFADWRVEFLQRTKIPSDTRSLDVLLVRLTT